jgi:hypothetical protein
LNLAGRGSFVGGGFFIVCRFLRFDRRFFGVLGFYLQQGIAFWESFLTVSGKLGDFGLRRSFYPAAAQCRTKRYVFSV